MPRDERAAGTRARHAARVVSAALLLSAAALLALRYGLVVWGEHRLARATDWLQVAEVAEPSTAAERRVWRAAATSEISAADRARLRPLSGEPSSRWQATSQSAAAAIDRNAALLWVLRDAAAGVDGGDLFPIPPPPSDDDPEDGRRLATGDDEQEERSPELRALAAGRLLSADGMLAADAGQHALALADAETLAALARVVQRRPDLMHQLVGANLEGRLLELLRRVVEDPATPAADLERLRAALPRRDPGRAVQAALRWEGRLMLESFSTEPGRGRSRAGKWLLEGPDTLAVARVLDGYRELAAHASAGELELRIERSSRDGGPYFSYAGAVLDLMMPNFVAALVRVEAVAAARQIADLALELRLAQTELAAGTALDPTAVEPALASRGPDPFAGGRIEARYSRAGLVLSNPAAATHFHRVLDGSPPPPFVWRLPV